MRILTLATTAIAGLALQGCIYYEDDCGGGDDCRWDFEDDRSDDGDGWCDVDDEDDDDCDDEDEAPVYEFSLNPSNAEQGETFLATLSVEGEYDLSTIVSVEMNGADVRWQELRDNGVMLLVDAPELGSVDVVITEADGDVVVVEAALTVSEIGSGNSADDCE
ncbi:MAG: hypothetical protein AB8H79_03595 [Myxococcota bacterium]